MDIQSAATQLLGALGNNPDMLSQFASHPYSTTAQVTGTNGTISQNDMSRIIAQLAAQATTGQNLGSSETNDLAAALMGQSGGSVHNLASMLFGGGTATQAAAAQSATSTTTSAKATGAKKKRTSASSSSQTASTTASNAAANAGGLDLTSLLGSLAGGSGSSGTPSMAELVAKSVAGGVAARGMASLITGALGANKKKD